MVRIQDTVRERGGQDMGHEKGVSEHNTGYGMGVNGQDTGYGKGENGRIQDTTRERAGYKGQDHDRLFIM